MISRFDGQIALPFVGAPLRPRFQTFCVSDENSEAFAATQARTQGDILPPLVLVGPRGCGKSHLLAAAADAGRAGGPVLALGPDQPLPQPDELKGLSLLVVDDIDRCVADDSFCGLMMVLWPYPGARPNIIGATEVRPNDMQAARPDVISRLSAALHVSMDWVSDAGQGPWLAAMAKQLGLRFEQPAIDYLLRRVDRDPATLTAVLRQVAEVTLQQQRTVSVPLLRSIIHSEVANG
ncbi:hypothetical protein OAS86_04670 [Gammaproteobacteria bacterium]|nr:hypothetical protein [Gammaproteobacteria bacterium]